MTVTSHNRMIAARAMVFAAMAVLMAGLVWLVAASQAHAELTRLDDGEYEVPASLSGGSGRASIASPAAVSVSSGSVTATIVWSSSNYDRMTVAGKDYAPTTTEGGSTFEIPVTDDEMKVKAETTAMDTPHTIDYTIGFDMANARAVSDGTASAALVAGALAVLLAVGIVLGVVSSRRKSRR